MHQNIIIPILLYLSMKVVVSTLVNQDMQTVFSRFDKELFMQLSPPFPPLKLERFDGSRQGDEVHVLIKPYLKWERWETQITEHGITDTECWFVDEGKVLPSFLTYWRHKHRIVSRGKQCEIIDEVEYKAPFLPGSWFYYPVIKAQFMYRKPIYREYFS